MDSTGTISSTGQSLGFNRGTLQTDTSSEVNNIFKENTPPASYDELGPTMGASAETKHRFSAHVSHTSYARTSQGGLDKNLLKRALDIVQNLGEGDEIDRTNNMGSLSGIILQLWEDASQCTQFHQEILAIVESAIISTNLPTEEQLLVFSEAIMDLQRDVLSEQDVSIIQLRFLGVEFSPLALLSEVEDESSSD